MQALNFLLRRVLTKITEGCLNLLFLISDFFVLFCFSFYSVKYECLCITDCILTSSLEQVLSKEEYACWLKSRLEAESSIENREELLFQSALQIEKNLHLLGNEMKAGHKIKKC